MDGFIEKENTCSRKFNTESKNNIDWEIEVQTMGYIKHTKL